MRTKNLLKGAVIAASAALLGLVLILVAGYHNGASPQAALASSSAAAPTQAVFNVNAAAPMFEQVAFTKSPAKGKAAFLQTCAMCHGPAGQGTPMGADLQTSKFVASLSDAQLVAFIEHGRPASAPNNTMHETMPPKGGNPELTTQDLYNIVAYIRTINKAGAKHGAAHRARL